MNYLKYLTELVPNINSPWTLASFCALVILLLVIKSDKIKIDKTLKGILIFALSSITFICIVTILSNFYLDKSKNESGYQVYVTVLDLNNSPEKDVKIETNYGSEIKKTNIGWQIDIPIYNLSKDKNLIIYATKEEDFLQGQKTVTLGDEKNINITISLSKNSRSFIRGIVIDQNKNSIPGVIISEIGYGASDTTNTDGSFSISSHNSVGQMTSFHFEKKGYKSINSILIGGQSNVIIIMK